MKIMDMLFPSAAQCAFCERRASADLICTLCLTDIQAIQGPICSQCGRPQENEDLCKDCSLREETFFISNRSAVQYNDKMKEIISLYKFRGHESLVTILASFLEKAYRNHYLPIPFDAITFVPLHPQRLRERSFNQSQQLAFFLSRKTKIPVVSLLQRTRSTDKQSKKHRLERLRTLQGAFTARPFSLALNNVLLIDDVYTTGATVNECARVLAAKGMVVFVLTVAR